MEQQEKRKRPILRWLGIGLFSILLLLCAVLALIQLPAVKDRISSKASSLLSSDPDRQIQLGKLEGFIPFTVKMDEIRLSDIRGTWLVFENVRLRWSPLELLRGAIVVNNISAAKIDLARLPQGPDKEEPPKESKPFQFPDKLPNITIEELAIAELSFGREAFGHSSVFELHGSLVQPEDVPGLNAFLQIRRIDEGPQTRADLSAELLGKPATLRIDLNFHEAAGGWVAAVAGMKDSGLLRLSLQGDGPLSAWHGKLVTDAGQYGELSTSLTLDAVDEIKLTLDGRYAIDSSLGSPQLKPVLGSEIRFDFLGRFKPSGMASIDKAEIEGSGYKADFSGLLDMEKGQFKSEFNLHIDDLSTLEALLDTPLKGKLALQGAFAGPVSEPRGTLSVELEEAELQGYRAGSIRTVLQTEPLGPLSPEFSGVEVSGQGSAERLAALSGQPLPENKLQWSLNGKVQARNNISISSFEINGDHLKLELAGHYEPAESTGSLDVKIHASDLEPVSAFSGVQLAGVASIEAHLSGDLGDRSASGEIKGFLEPSEGSPAPAALLGTKTTFKTRFELHEGSKLEVPALRLESSVMQFEAQTTVDIAADNLQADWQLSVPELAPLAPLAGKSLSGGLQAKGKIEGPLRAFKATTTIQGNEVRVDKIQLQRILLTSTVQGLPAAPDGGLIITLDKKNATIKASTDFSLEDKNLLLKSVALSAPGTEVRGEITGDLEKNLFTGYLNGEVRDLSPLGRFLEEPMAGSGTLRVELSPGKGGQDADLDVKGRALSTPVAEVRALTLSAKLQNVFEAPHGSANLQLENLRSADLEIDQLSFKAAGDEQGMKFQGMAAGQSISRFDLQTRGTIVLSSDAQKVRLEQFKGKFDKYPIELVQPLSVQIAQRPQRRLSLDELNLRLGKGRIKGSGQLDPKQVKLEADFQDIPLALARLFEGPSVDGSAEGLIRLSGAPSNPQASIDLQLNNVQAADPSLKDLPPMGLNASGRLQQSSFSVEAELQGLTEKPARAELKVPVKFSLEPFELSIPEASQLTGHVDAEADLARVTQLVPLDAQVMSGKATVKLDINGQIDTPQLDGFVTLENGSYENFVSGTVLKNLNMKIASSGRRLTIEKLQASDGGKGAVDAKGFMELDADKDFPLDLDLRLSNATLVRRHDVTGVVDGTLKIGGSTTDININGDLRASPAEINLPERLPPEMTELKVIEIHNGRENKQTVQEQDPDLDLPMQLSFDIKVNLPRRIFVRGWGLDSEWRGKLKITGTAEKPIITGSLSAVRGKVDFLNRRFDIVNGDMTFYGSSPPLPTLDITAEAKVKDVTARVTFSGPASDPKIILTSDPPLPQDEILATVLFGRSATDITPSQAVQLAMVARSLSGRGSGRQLDFMSRTRDFLGLDELEFDSSEDGLSKGTLGIGKYLTEGVYLNVKKGVGQGKDKAAVEVEVTPNITVESQIGSDSTSGIGINWKFDY